MVIKASLSAEIGALVDALGSADEVRREAAVARLSVVGARAVDRLTRAYAAPGDRRTRLGILRVLEAVGDHRALPIARAALGDGGDLAVAAAGVLRTLLDRGDAAVSADALDALMAAAIDNTNERRLRLAAFDALQAAPGDVRGQIAALRQAPADGELDRDPADADAAWRDAIEGRLPDRPETVREALRDRADKAPLNTLRKLIDAVRAREAGSAPGERDGWRSLRGAIHQALALRGSRVALYDLRESLSERDGALPASFLAALHLLGDESCLEPLAALWDRSADDERWRHQIAAAFHAIVRREKLARRHRILTRLRAQGRGILGR
jgi:hypothetical protein